MSEETSYERRAPRFQAVDRAQWDDWHWQQQNRLRKPADFDGVFELSAEEREAFEAASARFRVAVTPHYAALMDPDDPQCPIRRQALPHLDELQTAPFELRDPLAEEVNSPVPGLTHRYPDRALLYASHNCPVYCRHCTRKRKVSDPLTAASRDGLDRALAHIESTPQIRDVIVSGGDPLSLSDARLASILQRLRAIEHVEIIRVGTRNPVTLPQRITPALADVFRSVRPLYLHTHFNHPAEVGPDALRSLELLLDAGCVLGNQMVLLRGINDDLDVVLQLNRLLLRAGCRPYYMLQCDMAEGITHFRTPLEVGKQIARDLRGRIGGMGIPDFIVDLPGGGGKVELTDDPVVGTRLSGGARIVSFRSYTGETHDLVDVD